jgi:hypothetical protein
MTTEWTFTWEPGREERAPTATICPLKYDKKWAYAFEIDDGPTSAVTVSLPLLQMFTYTDAPPGVPGGKPMPFVGTAAIYPLRIGTGNETFLSWEQVHQLRDKGWGIVNHSYWHSGYGWAPAGTLTPTQLRDELYWSQTILAAEGENNRSTSHFVYPNGYMAYKPYLKEFGLYSASRVSGKPHNLRDPGLDFIDMDRNYLDEGVWVKANDVMQGFPATLRSGDLVIDFTHGMEANPQSANHRRWIERLTQLTTRYGRTGDDTVWCAPTSEIVEYTLAARAAVVQCQRGRLTVRRPTALPGAALTLKLSGVDPHSRIIAPPGGRLYRQGDQVWITTPVLGRPGVPPPAPLLKRIYVGPVQNVTLAKPARIAGIRVLQRGEPKPGFHLQIGLITPQGHTEPFLDTPPGTNWGAWLLYPIAPHRPAISAQGIQINSDPVLLQMEVWAIAE